MKNTRSILLILLLSLYSASFSQIPTRFSFEEKWKLVEQHIEQQLPESALGELKQMLVMAERYNQADEIFKIRLHQFRLQLEIDPDLSIQVLKEFEVMADGFTDAPDRAIVHAMLAELYFQYYSDRQWQINRRTELESTNPLDDDVDSWTRKQYLQKISALMRTAMSDPAMLKITPLYKVEKYFSRELLYIDRAPTLFDYLSYNLIDMMLEFNDRAAVDRIYRDLIAFRANQSERNLLIMAELDYLRFKESTDEPNSGISEKYLTQLDSLALIYHNDPAVVEILAEKAGYYLKTVQLSGHKRIAYRICEEGISRFPLYERIALLLNLQSQITAKTINSKHQRIIKPRTEQKINVWTTNVAELVMEVYRIEADGKEYISNQQNRRRTEEKELPRQLIETRIVTIPYNPDFSDVETTLTLRTGDYGIYEYVLFPKGDWDAKRLCKGEFTVTDFSFMRRSVEKDKTDYYVLDRISGQPVKDVTLTRFKSKWNGNSYDLATDTTLLTDRKGWAQLESNNSNQYVLFSKGADHHFFTQSINDYYYRAQESDPDKRKTTILTDRSLYRPGQTVYYKAIAYQSNAQKEQVQTNIILFANLIDANGKQIATQKIRTNEFGSAAGGFVLPVGGLNGNYRIEIDQSSTSFKVEAYKRPTFEVKLEKPTTEMRFDDSIHVTGTVKAYAGYQLPGARISYSIKQNAHHFWRWIYDFEEKIVDTGSLITDANGQFIVSFVPRRVNDVPGIPGRQSYYFSIEIDATDTRGETQQGSITLPVSDQSLFILAEIPERVDKHKQSGFKISTETILGEKIDKVIRYRLYKTHETGDYSENISNDSSYVNGALVGEGDYFTQKEKLDLKVDQLSSGRYRLVLRTTDNHEEEVRSEHLFILYGANDRRPAVKTYSWINESTIVMETGRTARVRFGTSVSNANVLYELIHDGKVIESKWISINNRIKTFKFRFDEEYSSGVEMRFSFIRDERLITSSVSIKEKPVEKKLTPTLTVFRDKLLPGEEATWTVTIPEEQGRKAELLVGMYDASLDAIYAHRWMFNPNYQKPYHYTPDWNSGWQTRGRGRSNIMRPMREYPQPGMNEYQLYGLSLSQYSPIRYKRNMRIQGSEFENIVVHSVSDALQGKVAGLETESIEEDSDLVFQIVSSAQPPKPTIRTNFNETAFFYPQLHCDEEGNFSFSFTAPESLTRWNMKMLAHTPDLYHGQAQTEVVTTKDLMVQLNMPRFVRSSDKLVLKASVVNLIDSTLRSTVRLSLIDPATNQALPGVEQIELTIEAKSTAIAVWELPALGHIDQLICRVEAIAGRFSDGEQQWLMVLPDEVLVTETLPMTIKGQELKTFHFEALEEKAAEVETRQLTLEFTSNPVWYALQALPVLSEPKNESSIDYFMAWYANAYAAQLLKQQPELVEGLKQLIKNEDPTSLMESPLSKNEELKQFMLNETPWLLEANNETEQMRRIALLFDENQQVHQRELFLKKLKELQQPSGAFTWYPGMGESRWVTQLILDRFRRIQDHTAAEKQMIEKGLAWLDSETVREFRQLPVRIRNYDEIMTITPQELQYMLIRQHYSAYPLPDETKEAWNYYLEQIEAYYKTFSLFAKAQAAQILDQADRKELSALILKSLKEMAIKSPEEGMWWSTQSGRFRWHERPLAVHTRILESFNLLTDDQEAIDAMKLWLVRQKQSQQWESTLVTLDAVAALSSTGSNWTTRPNRFRLISGNEELKIGGQSALTGYSKQIITADQAAKGITVAPASSNSNAPAWGAMYWQYYQKIDQLTSTGSGMQIDKKHFLLRIVDNQRILEILDGKTLKTGDRVVTRMVVTVDRNLEFVALKDQRSACLEPLEQLSGSAWKENVVYYRTVKDASTQYFFSHLPRGTYVFEDEYFVNNEGQFSGGAATIQCLYAPEYTATTGAGTIRVGATKEN